MLYILTRDIWKIILYITAGGSITSQFLFKAWFASSDISLNRLVNSKKYKSVLRHIKLQVYSVRLRHGLHFPHMTYTCYFDNTACRFYPQIPQSTSVQLHPAAHFRSVPEAALCSDPLSLFLTKATSSCTEQIDPGMKSQGGQRWLCVRCPGPPTQCPLLNLFLKLTFIVCLSLNWWYLLLLF